jgi:hypothetical protein
MMQTSSSSRQGIRRQVLLLLLLGCRGVPPLAACCVGWRAMPWCLAMHVLWLHCGSAS